ncbi:hypothetical protein ACWGNN_45180 [Streptomyces sp. NPDC055817]|uniref:hypothetical protein n=1 Tax=Streptomyces sp. NPDC058441 TaxID=3346502 RepID=UPI0036562187
MRGQGPTLLQPGGVRRCAPAWITGVVGGGVTATPAFGKWIAESEGRSFLDIEREVLGELVAMAAGAT